MERSVILSSYVIDFKIFAANSWICLTEVGSNCQQRFTLRKLPLHASTTVLGESTTITGAHWGLDAITDPTVEARLYFAG